MRRGARTKGAPCNTTPSDRAAALLARHFCATRIIMQPNTPADATEALLSAKAKHFEPLKEKLLAMLEER